MTFHSSSSSEKTCFSLFPWKGWVRRGTGSGTGGGFISWVHLVQWICSCALLNFKSFPEVPSEPLGGAFRGREISNWIYWKDFVEEKEMASRL